MSLSFRLNGFFRRVAPVLFAAALAVAPASSQETAPAPAAAPDNGFATTGGDPFAKGENVIFAALAAGIHGGYGATILPPLTIGFDHAFHDYITAGGMFSFSRYDYINSGLTYLTFVGRGTFHPTMWLKRVKVPIDPYGIAVIGYSHAIWDGPGSGNYSYAVWGPGVGIRYWFNPRLSGQAESGVGNGVGLLSAGLAYKL